MNIPIRIPLEPAEFTAPEWSISPSPFDWQVMLYGGVNPRNGIEWLPLEFQFLAKFYSRKQIMQRAADLAEYHKRDCFIVREPSDPKFLRNRERG